MRISTLMALAAVLFVGVTVASPGHAAQSQAGHLPPVAQSDIGLKASQSVAVLYSENTVSNLQYLEQYHSVAFRGAEDSKLDERIRQAFIGSSDPRLAIERLQGALQDRFAKVTVYDNLDAALQAKPDVVVMLDTYNRLVTQRNSKIEARYAATFYDANLQYIGKAEGFGGKDMTSAWVQGKAAVEIAARIDEQRVLQLDALKRFDDSLQGLMDDAQNPRVAAN